MAGGVITIGPDPPGPYDAEVKRLLDAALSAKPGPIPPRLLQQIKALFESSEEAATAINEAVYFDPDAAQPSAKAVRQHAAARLRGQNVPLVKNPSEIHTRFPNWKAYKELAAELEAEIPYFDPLPSSNDVSPRIQRLIQKFTRLIAEDEDGEMTRTIHEAMAHPPYDGPEFAKLRETVLWLHPGAGGTVKEEAHFAGNFGHVVDHMKDELNTRNLITAVTAIQEDVMDYLKRMDVDIVTQIDHRGEEVRTVGNTNPNRGAIRRSERVGDFPTFEPQFITHWTADAEFYVNEAIDKIKADPALASNPLVVAEADRYMHMVLQLRAIMDQYKNGQNMEYDPQDPDSFRYKVVDPQLALLVDAYAAQAQKTGAVFADAIRDANGDVIYPLDEPIQVRRMDPPVRGNRQVEFEYVAERDPDTGAPTRTEKVTGWVKETDFHPRTGTLYKKPWHIPSDDFDPLDSNIDAFEYRAGEDFQAGGPGEISIKAGDQVKLVTASPKTQFPGWWMVEVNGQTGLVPKSHLDVKPRWNGRRPPPMGLEDVRAAGQYEQTTPDRSSTTTIVPPPPPRTSAETVVPPPPPRTRSNASTVNFTPTSDDFRRFGATSHPPPPPPPRSSATTVDFTPTSDDLRVLDATGRPPPRTSAETIVPPPPPRTSAETVVPPPPPRTRSNASTVNFTPTSNDLRVLQATGRLPPPPPPGRGRGRNKPPKGGGGITWDDPVTGPGEGAIPHRYRPTKRDSDDSAAHSWSPEDEPTRRVDLPGERAKQGPSKPPPRPKSPPINRPVSVQSIANAEEEFDARSSAGVSWHSDYEPAPNLRNDKPRTHRTGPKPVTRRARRPKAGEPILEDAEAVSAGSWASKHNSVGSLAGSEGLFDPGPRGGGGRGRGKTPKGKGGTGLRSNLNPNSPFSPRNAPRNLIRMLWQQLGYPPTPAEITAALIAHHNGQAPPPPPPPGPTPNPPPPPPRNRPRFVPQGVTWGMWGGGMPVEWSSAAAAQTPWSGF